jgi:glycerol-3-phosphate acyltransferase PlsY
MLVIFPLLTLAMTGLWVALARLTHKASVASVTVAVAYPIAVALAGHEWGDVVVISVLALVVVVRHLSNLRRLVAGEEHDLDPTNERDEPPDVGGQRAAS